MRFIREAIIIITILSALWGILDFIYTTTRNNQTANSYINSAHAHLRVELFDEARTQFQRALSIKPHAEQAILGERKVTILAMIRSYGRDTWLAARELALQLLENNEYDTDLLAMLARLETQLRGHERGSDWKQEALMYADRALNIDPAHPQALLARSIALGSQGQIDDALKLLEKLVSDNPTYERAHFILAQVYKYDEKDYHRAVESYRRAITLAPNLPGPKVELGKLLVRLGVTEAETTKSLDRREHPKVVEGLALLYEAVELDPSRPLPHRFLARSLARAGDSRAGIAEFDIARCLIEEGKYVYPGNISAIISGIKAEIEAVRQADPSITFVSRRPGSCLDRK